jgi:hypothetical protein
MEDNFALRYVLKHPGVNSRAELVPSPRAYARNGASRRGSEIIGTLSKQDGNATTTAIHTMIFLISYKINE